MVIMKKKDYYDQIINCVNTLLFRWESILSLWLEWKRMDGWYLWMDSHDEDETLNDGFSSSASVKSLIPSSFPMVLKIAYAPAIN